MTLLVALPGSPITWFVTTSARSGPSSRPIHHLEPCNTGRTGVLPLRSHQPLRQRAKTNLEWTSWTYRPRCDVSWQEPRPPGDHLALPSLAQFPDLALSTLARLLSAAWRFGMESPSRRAAAATLSNTSRAGKALDLVSSTTLSWSSLSPETLFNPGYQNYLVRY